MQQIQPMGSDEQSSERRPSAVRSTHAEHEVPKGGHGGHGLLMIACCIPMLVIAVVLVATGVVNPGFLFAAIACTVMMALMMRMMMPGSRGGID